MSSDDLIVGFGLKSMVAADPGLELASEGEQADVVVADLPDLADWRLARIAGLTVRTPVLALMGVARVHQAVGLLRRGFQGVLFHETYTPESLADAARSVAAGEHVLDPVLHTPVVPGPRQAVPLPSVRLACA
ncbi:DNA-binding NarL/FixJ family response regulator [Crossiella equi]|uniref:DNA-binding NarL/FixJ family response regulator n=1 Tax=Crossiella equi TaxID=130796 RepID=A0ABS5AGZ1_9PSEU|nr:response regulator transcription factor [Crossiella equi]MBP2475547.1 DNA-binding NarL/FixJ family response regulator [Crossiella equi]